MDLVNKALKEARHATIMAVIANGLSVHTCREFNIQR